MERQRHRTQYPGIRYRLDARGQRRYIVDYVDGQGQQRNVTLPAGYTLEDARLKRGDLLERKSKGETLVPTKQRVGELLDDWLEDRKGLVEEKTIQDYTWAIEHHLKPRLGRVKVRELTVDHVVRFRKHLQRQGLKKWSIQKIETPLRNALTVAARDGAIPANPYSKILTHERVKADQKQTRCMAKDEIGKLLASSSERWKPLFSTLLFTGLRIGEALALTWDDIDLTNNVVKVRKGKTLAATREVLLIPSLRRTLVLRKLSCGLENPFPFTDRAAYSALERACEKAGIERYSPHELRHTFASILIDQGEPVTFVARQLGHKSPDLTLKVYAHLFEAQDRIDRARERLQAAFGGMV